MLLQSITQQINNNIQRSYLILVFFIAFFAMIALILGKLTGYGNSFLGIALLISSITSIASYYYSDKMVLSLSGAKPIDKKDNPDIYLIINKIAKKINIPIPKIYLIDDPATNAFATGRDPQHASICITNGLITKLTPVELEGVLAHEISHIQNYDTRLMAIVSILVGSIVILSDWFLRSLMWGGRKRDEREGNNLMFFFGIVLAFISPFMATIIQLAISRKREFLADASSALITQNPYNLAIALEKISQDKEVLKNATNATAHIFLVNPFKDKKMGIWFTNLFNTHPPVAERIRILKSM